MVLRKIRGMVTRLVVIAALALTVFGGSVAVSSPSKASAAYMTCAQAIAVGDYWMSIGNLLMSQGNYADAENAYIRASAYYAIC